MKLQKFSPVIIRLGLSMVFIWFGTNQLLNQAQWISLIPKWVLSMSGLSAGAFVTLNGIFEIIMAVLLAIGIGIRLVASLLTFHLLMIIGDLGLNAIGIRDVGLLFATLSIAFHGGDIYSYDNEENII